MTAWSDGYVIDVEYTEHAFPDLAPAYLSAAAVLLGQPPVDFDRRLVWVELGCGNGLTAVQIAAACPNIEVWACDFNPAHVERARSLAEHAGLTNCTFEERSFADLAEPGVGPPHADFIVAHGVWSWVSESARSDIVQIVSDRLVTGGLLVVSYNLASGWSTLVPVQEWMRLVAEADSRPSSSSILSILDEVKEFFANDPIAELGPPERSRVGQSEGFQAAYLAHEFLNGQSRPMMQFEVIDAFAKAKCIYLGSTTLSDVGGALQGDALAAVPERRQSDRALLSTLDDFMSNRAFRSSLFRKGAVFRGDDAHGAAVDALEVVNVTPRELKPADFENVIKLTGVPVTAVLEVIKAFGDNPRLIGDIASSVPALDLKSVRSLVVELIRLGAVRPCLPSHGPSSTGLQQLNRHILAEVRAGRGHVSLASALLGGPAVLDQVTMRALAGVDADGVEPGVTRQAEVDGPSAVEQINRIGAQI